MEEIFLFVVVPTLDNIKAITKIQVDTLFSLSSVTFLVLELLELLPWLL